jgi:CDP-glucose 4,6-dehydratase
MGGRKSEVENMGINSSFWKSKRVFVTGHTGFKGSWLCKILKSLGADVTGYALAPDTEPSLFDICKPKVFSVIDDIRDYEKLSGIFKKAAPEIVIHMAAQPLVLDSYKNPRYTYDVNVMGTVNILECVRRHGGVKSLLNVTTDKVYLNKERAEGYREDEQLNGYDPYSNSKSCSELVTSSYCNSFFKQENLPVSTVRSGNVIGGGDFAENRLIPDCARFLAAGEAIKIRNPDSIRPYQHVLDTLFAYLIIAEKQYENPALSGAYNVGPEESDSATSGELADYFCKAWGESAKWERVHVDNPHESGLLKLNCDKMKKAFNWNPRWDIKKAVNETALWYKEYYGGGDASGVMERQINLML